MDRLRELAGQVPSAALLVPAVPPRSLRYRLHDAHRQALVNDYQNGTPTTELTGRYQLSKGSVLQILEDAGIQMRRQGLTEDQAARAVQLYKDGLSLAQVATRLHSAPTTINRALVARGVTLRGRHDHR